MHSIEVDDEVYIRIRSMFLTCHKQIHNFTNFMIYRRFMVINLRRLFTTIDFSIHNMSETLFYEYHRDGEKKKSKLFQDGIFIIDKRTKSKKFLKEIHLIVDFKFKFKFIRREFEIN